LGIDLYDYRDQDENPMDRQPQQAPNGSGNGNGGGNSPQRKRKKKKTELVRFAARTEQHTNTNNTHSTTHTHDNEKDHETKTADTTKRGENSAILHHFLQKDATSGLSPALSRRLRDFSFAQDKRRETYGYRYPWGIIGLYDHLTGIRVDVEWAEDAAWRRENGEPYLSWSDFESIKDRGFNQPFFTYIVMFVCTGCLVLSIGVNDWKIEPLTENPMIGPSAQTLIDVGAKKTSLIVNDGEWYRLFSPMFLHAGVIHFVLNMLALWFVGYAVEMNHGFVSAAILFIVPAIGGTIISALFLPEYISVGASGGIFGLIGGCIADIVSNWQLLFSKQVNPVDDGKRFRHVWVLIWLLLDILLVRTP
jgi:membrane associated rhomboid family serine protease